MKAIVSVVAGIVIGAFGISLVKISLAANSGSKRCDYSYIEDSGKPEIGEGGMVKYSDDDWKKMVEGGWQLKLKLGSTDNGGSYYIFEKCN